MLRAAEGNRTSWEQAVRHSLPTKVPSPKAVLNTPCLRNFRNDLQTAVRMLLLCQVARSFLSAAGTALERHTPPASGTNSPGPRQTRSSQWSKQLHWCLRKFLRQFVRNMDELKCATTDYAYLAMPCGLGTSPCGQESKHAEQHCEVSETLVPENCC